MRKRVGRSSDGKTITFQIDDKAREALDALEAAELRVQPGMLRVRSAVIRTAIIEAAERIAAGKVKR